MKQKIVVKVTMTGHKSRSKALKIAVGLLGVEAASFKDDDKSQIEITGNEVDPVQLICLLKKSMGYAELISVTDADGEKKEEQKEEPKPPEYCMTPSYYYAVQAVPSCGYVEHHGPSCSIM